MTWHHPWRELAAHAHVTITATPGERSRTTWNRDGTVTVSIDTAASQRTRRSIAAHELVHVERGIPTSHGGVLAAREEWRVDVEAARRLIPIDRLADVAAWTTDLYEAAEELWVHPHTLSVRLATLTPTERDRLEDGGE